MRGEDLLSRLSPTIPLGSPPHARGRPNRQAVAGNPLGITPACAGKTLRKGIDIGLKEDHPRMRGEDDLPSPR